MAKTTALYARVSTDAQDHRSQVAALQKAAKDYAGPHRQYRDTCSGASPDLPELGRLSADIAKGKISRVLVFALDRISRRGIRSGLERLEAWLECGVEVVSIKEPWVAATADAGMRELLLSIAFWGAKQERKRISERTKAGMKAARARGAQIGRQKGSSPKWALAKRKVDPQMALSLKRQGESVAAIAERFGVSRQAIYSALRES